MKHFLGYGVNNTEPVYNILDTPCDININRSVHIVAESYTEAWAAFKIHCEWHPNGSYTIPVAVVEYNPELRNY